MNSPRSEFADSKYVAITGINDPDGDPVAVRVTGVTQDEPLEGHSHRVHEAASLDESWDDVAIERAGKKPSGLSPTPRATLTWTTSPRYANSKLAHKAARSNHRLRAAG